MNAALHRLLVLAAACVGVVLAACGSGGEDTPPPPAAPVVALQVQPVKTFSFTWADVTGASEYRLLEDADTTDAEAGYEQVASVAAGVGRHDHVVALHRRTNAGYVLQACNAGGCSDSAPVAASGALAAAIGYIKASNAGAHDGFGTVALSADGSTLAVGATGEASSATGPGGNQADDSATGSGAVYVFRRRGTAWAQEMYLKAGNAQAGDLFGSAVALSADGDTLAVGARQEDGGATGVDGDPGDNSALQSGAVYVFERSGTQWTQQAYVKAGNTGANDLFGAALALSGDGRTLAVGAMRESSGATGIGGDAADNSAPNSGAVYVYARGATGWSQQAYVKASNAAAGDYFGYALALASDGQTLVVGAHGESSGATGIDGNQADDSVPNSGAAYVFVRGAAGWAQQAYLKAGNPGAGDGFGMAVALSADGHTLAVGALGESSSAAGVDGDPHDNATPESGAAYLFVRQGTTWAQQAYVKASNPGRGDLFGADVALSADGHTLAVGTHWEAGSAVGLNGNQADDSALAAGAAYVFTRQGTTWRQRAYVKAPNAQAGDYFAAYLALSADGQTLAVGAPGERSSATGIGGDQGDNAATYCGAVYLY